MATVVPPIVVFLPVVALTLFMHVVHARIALVIGLTAGPHLRPACLHVNPSLRHILATIGISLQVALQQLAMWATARRSSSPEGLGGLRSISSPLPGTLNCPSTILRLLWISLEVLFRTQIARVLLIKQPLCSKVPTHHLHQLPLSRLSSRSVPVCNTITVRITATMVLLKTAHQP